MMLHADADFPSSPAVQESSLKILQHEDFVHFRAGMDGSVYFIILYLGLSNNGIAYSPFYRHLNVLNDGVLHWLVLDWVWLAFGQSQLKKLPPNKPIRKPIINIQPKCICDSISQALSTSDAFETCVVSKVAMMAALGAVAQHYIKFPGFDAGWQGRVEVARRSESSRISSGIPAEFLGIWYIPIKGREAIFRVTDGFFKWLYIT